MTTNRPTGRDERPTRPARRSLAAVLAAVGVLALAASVATPSASAGPDPADPSIIVTQTINGQVAGTSPGLTVAEGSTLSLVATVTNASPYALRSVSVTSGGDDPYRPYTCPQTTLAPGESMTCTLERLAPLPGRIAWAAAEVRGVYEDGPVGPRTQSADSYAHVDAPATDTGLALRKSINGDDANTAPGVAVAPGSTMAITFEVTNTSANPLHDIKVTDDTIGASDISCPSSYLEAGTSMTCTATLPAPAPGTTHTDHGYVIGNDYVDFWYATDVAHAWSVGAPVDTTTVPSGPWTLPNAPITVPAAATAPVSTTTSTEAGDTTTTLATTTTGTADGTEATTATATVPGAAVQGGSRPAGPASLARTGAESGPALWFGAALLTAGAGLVLAARRRRVLV